MRQVAWAVFRFLWEGGQQASRVFPLGVALFQDWEQTVSDEVWSAAFASS